jgi:hypothetical protein
MNLFAAMRSAKPEGLEQACQVSTSCLLAVKKYRQFDGIPLRWVRTPQISLVGSSLARGTF